MGEWALMGEWGQVFMHADSDGDGSLTYSDFTDAVQTLRYHRQVPRLLLFFFFITLEPRVE